MGDPAPGGEDDEPKEICFEDYIIIDDTDSDPDSSDDDYEDEAGANIMESSTDQNFQSTTILLVVFPHVQYQSEHFCNGSQIDCMPLFELIGVI